jgi:hypothetical protein
VEKLSIIFFEQAYLGHNFLIGFLLWIGPINDNITIPHLHAAESQLLFSITRPRMAVVFQEAESSVFLAIIWATVNDYIRQTI